MANCLTCGSEAPGRVTLGSPGWVLVECGCGNTSEFTASEVFAARRADMVRAATIPEAPPVGPAPRPVTQGPERMRSLAFDMWRRGVIDEDTYRSALDRYAG